MATDFDAYDKPYATKMQAEQSAGVTVGPVYATSLKHKVNVKTGRMGFHPIDNYLIRAGPLPYGNSTNQSTVGGAGPTQSADQHFYDLGMFQLAVTGSSASTGTALGELWVHYDVELIRPVPPTQINGAVHFTTTNVVAATGTVDTWIPEVGSATTWSCATDSATGTTVTLSYNGGAGGQFMILITAKGSTMSSQGAISIAGSGSNSVAIGYAGQFIQNTLSLAGPVLTAAQMLVAVAVVVQPQVPGQTSFMQTVYVNKPVGLTAGGMDVHIYQVGLLNQ